MKASPFHLGRNTNAGRSGPQIARMFYSSSLLVRASSSVVPNHVCQIALFTLLARTTWLFVYENDVEVIFRNGFVFHLFHFMTRLLPADICSKAAPFSFLGASCGKKASWNFPMAFTKGLLLFSIAFYALFVYLGMIKWRDCLMMSSLPFWKWYIPAFNGMYKNKVKSLHRLTTAWRK